MKKKINKSNPVDQVFIFIVRAGLISVFVGTIVILAISIIIRSGEMLNYAKYIFPSILIFIGSYSVVFGVAKRPVREI
jgi:hypothetical protein